MYSSFFKIINHIHKYLEIPTLKQSLYQHLRIQVQTLMLFGIDKFRIGIEVCYKKLNPQINIPFNFLIQKYTMKILLHLEYKLFGVGIPRIYSW